MKYIWGLMKESPSPGSSVAVHHSAYTLLYVWDNGILLKMRAGSSPRVLAGGGPGVACLLTFCTLRHQRFSGWLDVITSVFKVREGEPWWTSRPCCGPARRGTERIERRGYDAGHALGESLLLRWKLHFLLNPLHFGVHLVAGPSRSSLASVGWAPRPSFTGDLDTAVANQGSHAVLRCGVKLSVGSLVPDPLYRHHLPTSSVCLGPLLWQWVLRSRAAPKRCLRCHGKFWGKDLPLKKACKILDSLKKLKQHNHKHSV